METREQAIKRLREAGEKELYLVRNFIEAEGKCTDLWNIYNNIDDALRWVELCKKAYELDSSFRVTSEWDFDGFYLLCRNVATDKATFQFKTGEDHDPLVNTFVFERVA